MPRAAHGGARSWARATSSSSTVPDAATATTIRRGSSRRPSASSCTCAGPRSPRRGFSLLDDCLFCTLAREGDHVARADGFVAVKDINPRADTHLLVIPERHVDTFRDVGEFPADEA